MRCNNRFLLNHANAKIKTLGLKPHFENAVFLSKSFFGSLIYLKEVFKDLFKSREGIVPTHLGSSFILPDNPTHSYIRPSCDTIPSAGLNTASSVFQYNCLFHLISRLVNAFDMQNHARGFFLIMVSYSLDPMPGSL